MNEDFFNKVTKVVIDKLEGGYFHPDMRTNNPKKFGSYHRSGETMFGLDRWAGHDLYYSTPRKANTVLEDMKYIYSNAYQYKTPEAKEFWTLIDQANARKNWKWLYRGGSLEPRLMYLTGKIMYPRYENLANRYLTAKSQQLINSDPRLLFHFIYALWNGPGWFKTFAQKFNAATEKGITNKDELLKVAMNSRINSSVKLISNGGKKINSFINTIDFNKDHKAATQQNDEPGNLTKLIMIGIGLTIAYYLTMKK